MSVLYSPLVSVARGCKLGTGGGGFVQGAGFLSSMVLVPVLIRRPRPARVYFLSTCRRRLSEQNESGSCSKIFDKLFALPFDNSLRYCCRSFILAQQRRKFPEAFVGEKEFKNTCGFHFVQNLDGRHLIL